VTGAQPGRLLVIGFSTVMARGLQLFRPDDSVIFLEEAGLARDRDAVTFLADYPCCSRLVEWDYLHPDAADEFFAAGALGERPAAIVPGMEHATAFAARLAERYGLPTATLGAAELMRDKARLRRVTAAAGVPNPVSRSVEGPAEVVALLRELGAPVIVKPSNRAGSAGVTRVDSPEQATAAFGFALTGGESEPQREWGDGGEVLVEEYLAGPEFSVEMLVEDGRPVLGNITAKTLFDGPRPIERGHVLPHSGPEAEEMLALTGRVVAATGFAAGIVHCEWIVTDRGSVLVECAGRIPGDGITALLGIGWGVDWVEQYVALMSGRLDRQLLPDQPVRSSAVALAAAEPGTVLAIDGLDRAGAIEGVLVVLPLVSVGDEVRPLRSSADRVALAISMGADPAEATARAEQAIALVRVRTGADQPVSSSVTT